MVVQRGSVLFIVYICPMDLLPRLYLSDLYPTLKGHVLLSVIFSVIPNLLLTFFVFVYYEKSCSWFKEANHFELIS